MKKGKFIRYLNHIPLWTQLFILMTFVFSIMIGVILFHNYSQNRKTILETRVTASNRLLDLELENLDQYINDLTYFSIQPCYDTKLSGILETSIPLSTWQQSYLKNQIRAYYYTRNDLLSYHIFLLNQDMIFGRDQNSQKINGYSDSNLKKKEGIKICSTKKNIAILPSGDKNSFFDFYYSIIRIKTREPVAVVNFTINTTFIDSITKDHKDNGEFICILNENNELLYSGDPEYVGVQTFRELSGLSSHFDADYFNVTLKNKSFIVTTSVSERYQVKLLAFTPATVIDTAINNTIKSSLLIGLLVWFIAILLITALIRLTTIPLSTLASHLRNVGNGDFTSTADINGNREIINLSSDFNYMIKHIDELIKKNYLSEINEKTSRLIALEAQLNPHFLYNTLQVISTEALVNDQPRIHKMITSLASILRYTIKGGDFVALQSEIDYVNHYIHLQKMRLEDRLSVDINIEEETRNLVIPKISIQTLVENSIHHGMGSSGRAIHIIITSKIENEFLTITVEDNGCGFKADFLEQLKEEFSKTRITYENTGIGLINLNSRLQLLYLGKAKLVINSQEGCYTSITLFIPVVKEINYV